MYFWTPQSWGEQGPGARCCCNCRVMTGHTLVFSSLSLLPPCTRAVLQCRQWQLLAPRGLLLSPLPLLVPLPSHSTHGLGESELLWPMGSTRRGAADVLWHLVAHFPPTACSEVWLLQSWCFTASSKGILQDCLENKRKERRKTVFASKPQDVVLDVSWNTEILGPII